ncbi:MAG: CaiB/BaiF CoA-transferase family protein [Acidimicrobiia bacterium]|nr:CaiB/BaiF CoA-transferase family protein [Acidimicrobiia bacterium]
MIDRTLPLDGVKVVELAGIGPAPFASGVLSDLGALVIRIERPSGQAGALGGLERLGVRDALIVELDLKTSEDLVLAREVCAEADVLIEGFRPGVAERLGLGPGELHSRNPGLVYVRITGWGQDGPYSTMAGHDINYIGLSGVLAAIGDELPLPPLNLIGDYAGGALYGVIGALAALLSRSMTGQGRVVDAAMIDGAGALMAPIGALRTLGMWSDDRASNLLDGGAPFYRAYETADARFVAVGALEPPFYAQLLHGLGLDAASLPDRHDRANWPALEAEFAAAFATRTQAEWGTVFDGTDACVTPVLGLGQVAEHPHHVARSVTHDDPALRPGIPAPRTGHGGRSRAEASVSDTLVAAGIQPEQANRLESSGLAYWVDVAHPRPS